MGLEASVNWLLAILAWLYAPRASCTGRAAACDSDCPGWIYSHSDQYGWNLERCDECARFQDDSEAIRHTYSCEQCRAQAITHYQ